MSIIRKALITIGLFIGSIGIAFAFTSTGRVSSVRIAQSLIPKVTEVVESENTTYLKNDDGSVSKVKTEEITRTTTVLLQIPDIQKQIDQKDQERAALVNERDAALQAK